MSTDLPVWQLKKQMCEIGKRIWQRGFCAGNEGNHSIRIGEDRFLCTPTGLSKGFLDPDDICVVDGEGNQVEENPRGRKRTSEVLVHLAIYKKRPDVGAVIHSHPPHAVAFCLANLPLPEGIHPEAEVFLGRVVNAKYATPGTPQLPASFIDQLTPETAAVQMMNHGSVTFGTDLVAAHYNMEILDNYCKQLILTKQLGQVNVLNQQEMHDLLEVKQKFGFNDSRFACAIDGCYGPDNESFLAGFDQNTASARCDESGQTVIDRSAPSAGVASGDAAYEAMVQAVTEQVMAALA